jgi:hypothetical protein
MQSHICEVSRANMLSSYVQLCPYFIHYDIGAKLLYLGFSTLTHVYCCLCCLSQFANASLRSTSYSLEHIDVHIRNAVRWMTKRSASDTNGNTQRTICCHIKCTDGLPFQRRASAARCCIIKHLYMYAMCSCHRSRDSTVACPFVRPRGANNLRAAALWLMQLATCGGIHYRYLAYCARSCQEDGKDLWNLQ